MGRDARKGRNVELDGMVALVTGGASGIGRATAARLAAAGAVVVIADVAEEAGKRAAADLGGRFVHLDVTDAVRWAAAVDDVVERHGGLHVAVLNAGVAGGATDITAVTEAQYRRVVGVNVDGVVFGLRATVPAISRSGGGAIVATASLGGLVPMPLDPLYSATKHAVVGLVRSLAPQLSERGVAVNAVCPGFADTPLVTPEARAVVRAMDVPLLQAGEVAEGIMGILADDGTGQAWYCQPGRPCAPYAFRGVPGPR